MNITTSVMSRREIEMIRREVLFLTETKSPEVLMYTIGSAKEESSFARRFVAAIRRSGYVIPVIVDSDG